MRTPPLLTTVREMRSLTMALVLAVFAPPALHGQEIRIKLLDARNGKPAANECLNVWTGTERGEQLIAKTNDDGTAVLRSAHGNVVAETACREQWPLEAPLNARPGALMLVPEWHVACQEYTRVVPEQATVNPLTRLPSYPVKRILELGVSASNTCGRFREQAKPGELILFVRPRTFLEKMRQ